MTPEEMAERSGAPLRPVRRLVRAGLLDSKAPPDTIDFQQMAALRLVRTLASFGLQPARIERVVSALRRQFSESLASVQVEWSAGRVVARLGECVFDPASGQIELPLVLGAGAPAESASPSSPPPAEDAAGLFAEALDLEDERPEQALALYRRVVEADPLHVEAYINLGTLCSANGDQRKAAAYFTLASKIDPFHPVAAFNQAVMLHGLGAHDEALALYRRALELDPHFTDAHFNLAAILEARGDPRAQFHRQQFEALSS